MILILNIFIFLSSKKHLKSNILDWSRYSNLEDPKIFLRLFTFP